MTGKTVLIADDHPLFRRGLREAVEAGGHYRVTAEAADGAAAIAAMASSAPDLAILDLAMPKKDGLAVVAWIHAHAARTRSVILTLYKDAAFVDRAAALGASAYLVKDDADAEVLRCLDTVVEGEFYVSASVGRPNPVPPTVIDGAAKKRLVSLTAAQRSVLRHLAEYRTSKEIARLLDISPKTVENHRANMVAALDIHGPNALLRFAIGHRGSL